MIRETRYGDVRCFEAARSLGPLYIWTVRFYFCNGVLVDTGPPNLRDAVLALVGELGPEAVLLTHHHEDHSGNAAAIASNLEIPVFASPRTATLVSERFHQAFFQLVTWGRFEPATVVPVEELQVGGSSFEAIQVPGHSPDMTAWHVRDRGWLFTGDLYIADKVKMFRYDEDASLTMSSLERVLELDFESLWCGHNPKPRNGKARIEAKLDYMKELCRSAAAMYEDGCSFKETAKSLLGDDTLVRWFTGGLVSGENLVRSAVARELTLKAVLKLSS